MSVRAAERRASKEGKRDINTNDDAYQATRTEPNIAIAQLELAKAAERYFSHVDGARNALLRLFLSGRSRRGSLND